MVCERHGDWKVIREERAACRMGQSSYHIHVLCIYINLYKNIIYIYIYIHVPSRRYDKSDNSGRRLKSSRNKMMLRG